MQQVYAYSHPSAVVSDAAGAVLALATSGGVVDTRPAEHPFFFDGLLRSPEQAAQALLLVAKVARTRFYLTPSMLAAILRAADPVVTSNGDRLRFESFSACAGVYVRLDVLPDGLATAPLSTGTTNVDVNEPLQLALALVGGSAPLRLRVGEDVEVITSDRAVTEVRVPLPERWLRGFAEVQLAGARMQQTALVPVAEARRFLRSLPAASGAGAPPLWVMPAGAGLRVTSRNAPGAACLGGPERLRLLEPLLRFSSGLRVFGLLDATPGEPGASGWVLELDGARLTMLLSPQTSRGFSGEGAVLPALADPQAGADAELICALLAYEPRIDVPGLVRDSALDATRVLRALARLGAAGRVGFDLAESAYFHRELPYEPEVSTTAHPRLRDARRLVADGRVRRDGAVVLVVGRCTEHVVRRTASGPACTCSWYAQHGRGRGPCAHVLAADLLEQT